MADENRWRVEVRALEPAGEWTLRELTTQRYAHWCVAHPPYNTQVRVVAPNGKQEAISTADWRAKHRPRRK
jgi:hypothetical protein